MVRNNKLYLFIILSIVLGVVGWIVLDKCYIEAHSSKLGANSANAVDAVIPLSDSSSQNDITVLPDSKSEDGEIKQPNEYAAYEKVIKNYQKKYGDAHLKPSFENDWIVYGLSIVRLLDFDGDGIDHRGITEKIRYFSLE